MMDVSAGSLDGIRSTVSRLDASVSDFARSVIEREFDVGPDAVRDALVEVVSPVAKEAASVSASAASAVFNAWRKAGYGETMQTVDEPSWTQGKWNAMANTVAKRMESGATLDSIASIVSSRVGYDNRNAFSSTIMANVRRDKARPMYARVPSGSETCPFCIMLASRGFAYNKGKAGTKVHNHANCDCVYVVSWSKDPKVEGYDPSSHLETYYENLGNGNLTREQLEKSSARSKANSASDWFFSRNGYEFSCFQDVLDFVGDSKSKEDLYRRYSILRNIYGDMASNKRLLNHLSHVEKRL